MQMPSDTKPACWGAVGGAIALTIVGFTWGGWVTGGTAQAQAQERADAAVVNALAPICADRFMRDANASGHLVELKKVSSWERASLVEKGGWAILPGSTTAATGVAGACAEILEKPKT